MCSQIGVITWWCLVFALCHRAVAGDTKESAGDGLTCGVQQVCPSKSGVVIPSEDKAPDYVSRTMLPHRAWKLILEGLEEGRIAIWDCPRTRLVVDPLVIDEWAHTLSVKCTRVVPGDKHWHWGRKVEWKAAVQFDIVILPSLFKASSLETRRKNAIDDYTEIRMSEKEGRKLNARLKDSKSAMGCQVFLDFHSYETEDGKKWGPTMRPANHDIRREKLRLQIAELLKGNKRSAPED